MARMIESRGYNYSCPSWCRWRDGHQWERGHGRRTLTASRLHSWQSGSRYVYVMQVETVDHGERTVGAPFVYVSNVLPYELSADDAQQLASALIAASQFLRSLAAPATAVTR